MAKSQVFWAVTVTVLFIFVGYLFIQHTPPKKPKYVTHAAICNADGVCLVNLVTEKDKDGDGFSDADEVAADTDPRDPKSYPAVRQLVDLAGKGGLDSFNRGLNYIVIIPEKLPNGDVLIKTGLPESRRDTAASLGVSEDRLKSVGLSLATGVTISALTSDIPDLRPPAGSGTKAPPVGLGKFGIGLISQKGDEEFAQNRGREGGMGQSQNISDRMAALAELQRTAAKAREAAMQAAVAAQEKAEAARIAAAEEKKAAEEAAKKAQLEAEKAAEKAKKLEDEVAASEKSLGVDKKKKRTTGDDDHTVIPLTKATFERAKIKLGQNRTPGPSVGPDPGDVDPADVVDGPDTIALFDGEQKGYPISDRLKYFIVAPELRPNSDKNTNYGPNGPPAIGLIAPGSGIPTTDPGRGGVGRTLSGQPN
jgi:hypothetical protein